MTALAVLLSPPHPHNVSSFSPAVTAGRAQGDLSFQSVCKVGTNLPLASSGLQLDPERGTQCKAPAHD